MKLSKKKISSRLRRLQIKRDLSLLFHHHVQNNKRKQTGGSLIQLSPGRSTGKVVKFTRNYF